MLWVSYCFIICLLFLVQQVKFSQRKYVYTVIGFLIVILIAGNYTNLDYANYRETYINFERFSHSKEWVYGVLIRIFNQHLHFTYNGFRLVTSVIAVWILIKSLFVFTDRPAMVLLAFCTFPFFYYSTLYRTFLGLGLSIYAIQYLEKFSVRNLAKYLCCILVLCGIHLSYAVYTLFILCYFMNKSKIVKVVIGIAVILTLTVSMLPDTLIMVVRSALTVLGDTDRMNAYANIVGTRNGYLIWWALQIMQFLIAKKAYEISLVWKQSQTGSENEKQIAFIKNVYYIVLISFLFCPLYRVQANFARIMLGEIPLLFLQWQCLKDIQNGYKEIAISEQSVYVWIYLVMFGIEIIGVGGLWKSVVVEMLTHNWIIELLSI